jgi:1-phosphofructokinase
MARVAVFGPNPLLTVAVETDGAGADEVHVHAGGQGVWVARMAGEMGATPVLCALAGGEQGFVLTGLLARMAGEHRLVRTAGASGCYVMDDRAGDRRLIALAQAPPPSRHELDDLVGATVAAAAECDALVVCNDFPAGTLPLEVYPRVVAAARAAGATVIVDLSPPRLNAALRAGPDLVKVNDWELAQYVAGPVEPPVQQRAAACRLLDAGARSVLVTRGVDGATWFDGRAEWIVDAPRFDDGNREGCGDAMTGTIAALIARGEPMDAAIRAGAAAGAANFLRHGLGSGRRDVVERLAARVELQRAA